MKLSEKGSEGDSAGGSGQHKAGQTGRKRDSRRSMGPRYGRLWDFSDSFLTGLWPLGCVANRIGQPFHEDPWDFYHVGLCR
jgi:hypothetical protein